MIMKFVVVTTSKWIHILNHYAAHLKKKKESKYYLTNVCLRSPAYKFEVVLNEKIHFI